MGRDSGGEEEEEGCAGLSPDSVSEFKVLTSATLLHIYFCKDGELVGKVVRKCSYCPEIVCAWGCAQKQGRKEGRWEEGKKKGLLA